MQIFRVFFQNYLAQCEFDKWGPSFPSLRFWADHGHGLEEHSMNLSEKLFLWEDVTLCWEAATKFENDA